MCLWFINMGKSEERVLLILAICVFVVHTPAEAWYKQAAGPSYYSVGRASGLLSGIRRSAIRRDEADTRDSGGFTQNNAILQTNSRKFALKNMVSSTTQFYLFLWLVYPIRAWDTIQTDGFVSNKWPETNPCYSCRKSETDPIMCKFSSRS